MAIKSLGQHWLYDKQALQAMASAADVSDQDTVVEIGPGHGTLTQVLVKKAMKVIAIEFDADLAATLYPKVQAQNLEVIQADIRKFDLTTLPKDYKIVANIPYYLTSYLLRLLIDTKNKPAKAVLLVQKEVAQKVAASQGDMSLLSMLVQLNYSASTGVIIKAGLFLPPPKVDSQILCLTRKAEQIDDQKMINIVRLIKHGFSSARKTIENNLASGLKLEKATVRQLLEQSKVEPARRAETLRLEEWQILEQMFNKYLTS